MIEGKTIQSIKNIDDRELIFYCTDGSEYKMYHQDCCEDVCFEQIAPPSVSNITKFSYKRKPVIIEAFKIEKNFFVMLIKDALIPEWAKTAIINQTITFDMLNDEVIIKTLEDGKEGQAKHVATFGDYIIQGVKGELYACKPDIFELTYEKV